MTTGVAARTDLAYTADGWLMFWFQLPMLVLGLAVIIVATIALIRARREDIPQIFAAFTSAFGHHEKIGHLRSRHSRSGQHRLSAPTENDQQTDFDEELR